MRELVDSGALGQLYYYDSTRINLGLFRRDVNVVWDLAIHDLSILQYLFGCQPLAVAAHGVSHVLGNPENMAQVTLYYDGGIIAHLNVNWLAPVKVRQVLLGGSKKMVVYDDLQPSDKLKVYDRGLSLSAEPDELRRIRVNSRTGDMWSPHLSTAEPLLVEAEHFIECVRTSATPVTDGRLGCSVVEILEAATQSMRRRGHPVDMAPLRVAG